MPSYLILARDKHGSSALRAETRPSHLVHLEALTGRVVVAGPFLDEAGGPVGSVILAEFDDLAAARAFADADPYAKAGLFETVTVAAWRQVLP